MVLCSMWHRVDRAKKTLCRRTSVKCISCIVARSKREIITRVFFCFFFFHLLVNTISKSPIEREIIPHLSTHLSFDCWLSLVPLLCYDCLLGILSSTLLQTWSGWADPTAISCIDCPFQELWINSSLTSANASYGVWIILFWPDLQ